MKELLGILACSMALAIRPGSRAETHEPKTAGRLVAERLTPTASTGGSASSFGPGRFKGVNLPISSLAWGLESILKRPVIDETALTNRYDLELQWEEKD